MNTEHKTINLRDIADNLGYADGDIDHTKTLIWHLMEYVERKEYNPYSENKEGTLRVYELCRNAPVIYAVLRACIMSLDEAQQHISTQSDLLMDEWRKSKGMI